jgi:8-oxo-dGTP pyrophosphatase MutT (NUDIX family)
VLEETGLHTSIVNRLGSRSYLLDPDSGEHDKTMVVFLLRAEDGGFRITLSEEHDEYRWVSDSDLGGIFGSDDLMRSVIHEYFISDSSL